MGDYVELHCHSCFSFREGASTPLELVLEARRLGYPALALTDHDGLAGAMEFAQVAKEWGVQPVIGAEVTLRGGPWSPVSNVSIPTHPPRKVVVTGGPFASLEGRHPQTPGRGFLPLHPRARRVAEVELPGQETSVGEDRARWTEDRSSIPTQRAHLTLLAETPRGYANLSRLLSEAHLSSPRGEPSLDPAALAGRTEGLIALSGCRQGEVARLAAAHDVAGAREAAARYRELFGREGFFIELQDNLVYGDRRRNRSLSALACELGLGVVATNNAHYHERARHRLQDVLVAVRHRTSLDASERLRRPNAEFCLKAPTEMASLFNELPEALENTLVIAERCQGFDLTCDLTYRFPDFEAPGGRSADEELSEVCRVAARELYGWSAPQIEERLAGELAVIRQAGQAGFFLRNWQLMRYAHEHDLPARGRGSSVGSLVCYLLGLSGIDPIKYDLFAGRFLNESRQKEDVPDIDIDFAREARERMFAHVFETYGTEHAALVANVIQYRYPMAIRDVGKALGLAEADIDKLAKRMRGRFAGTLEEEMRSLPEFRSRMQAPVWQEFARLVEELRGMPRHLSQHSGGVVISTTPMVEQVPVQPSAMAGRYICQWDKDSVADAGFIKMDFLGYPSLGHLYRSLKLIEERHGRRIDPVRIPLDDPAVYEMIQRGDILGIVQIQSRAQLQAILRLKISCIEDLVVQVALIRPGPIQGGAVNPYILRCQGAEPVTYDHECLEPVLAETKGVIVFQEQVLQVAMAVAGFTAGQAESLRRAMSRKRSREEMEKLHEAFLEGCRAQGKVDEATAERIYEKVLAFAEFGFPKAHAAAMAETAGKLAWVKRYYPLEFYCSWLNEWPFGFYSPGVIVNEARRNGIEVLGVDANRSRVECAIEGLPDGGEAVRLGFNYVKGIGEKWLARLEEVPHPDSMNTSERRWQIAPLPLGEGTGVREEETSPGAQGVEPPAAGLGVPALERSERSPHISPTLSGQVGGKESRSYASLWDFWRRTRLPREPIEHLVRLGAFAWTGLHERELLWQLGLFYQPLSGQLPLALPCDAELVPLREMSGGERVREDVVLTAGAIATRGHVMDLAPIHEGVTPSYQVDRLEEGTKVTVAGFVAVRQAPGTAKGFVFHTLEDRYGLINIITTPALVRKYKALVAEAGALIVHGHIERQERAVNVITERMEALPLAGAVPEARTHTFG